MAEHVLGTVEEFPAGTHRIVTVRNIELGIFNVDGTLYALPNICPHQHGPLCRGTVNGTMVSNADSEWTMQWGRQGQILTCPWHGIEFDITTGRSLASSKLKVRQYPIAVVDGEVRLRL